MVEDEARGVVVLFGGGDGETWEWDGCAWVFRTATGPKPRAGHVMAYDRARRRVVVYGASSLRDTWEWDGTVWVQRTTTAAPVEDGPDCCSMAFDPVRNRVVLYSRSYTWEYGPVHPATVTPFGNGCPGSAGSPSLAATLLPWLGDTSIITITSVPANTLVLVLLGYSNTSWPPLALPFSLAAAGMPGCTLYASGQLIVPAIVNGTTASLPLAIPQGPELLGAPFYAQSLVLDPPANAPGLTVSNAGAGRIGGR
jgi:hypothetical protein